MVMSSLKGPPPILVGLIPRFLTVLFPWDCASYTSYNSLDLSGFPMPVMMCSSTMTNGFFMTLVMAGSFIGL